MNPVVLFGATGYTGRLIASRLARSRIPFTAVGRNPDALAELVSAFKGQVAVKVADVTDYETVRRAIARGTKVVVSCVGPFIDLGENVVRAALEARAHYLDTTGEQYFMRQVHWRYHEQAKVAGRAVVNAMAFEYALGDFGARLLAERMKEGIDLLEIFYYIPSFNPSRGTTRSMMVAMQKPVLGFEGGKLVELKAGAFRKNLHLKGQAKPFSALSFPGGEVFTVPQHVPLKTLRDYMVMSVSTARLLYGSAPSVLHASSKARVAEEARQGDGPTPAQRRANRFHLILEGTKDEQSQTCTISGTDVYGLTAAIVFFGVRQLLDGKVRGSGVLPPARAFDENAFWSAVTRNGVTVEYGATLLSS